VMPTASTAFGLALVAAFLLGLRHGSDYDHIAAITDLGSAEREPGRAMRLGLLYALGHAATVLVLGLAAILFRVSLPERIDRWSQQVVGLTLLGLGVYVLYASVFGTEEHAHPRSRFRLLADGLLYCGWRVRRMFVADDRPRPRLELQGVSPRASVVIGIVHGVGAETPTQVMLFLLAANLGGVTRGVLGLAAFLVGLFAMNALLSAATAGLLRVSGGKRPRLRLVAGASAAYSIVLGCLFLAGPWLR
jgi:cytochrome c biogenesis protein CcdA